MQVYNGPTIVRSITGHKGLDCWPILSNENKCTGRLKKRNTLHHSSRSSVVWYEDCGPMQNIRLNNSSVSLCVGRERESQKCPNSMPLLKQKNRLQWFHRHVTAVQNTFITINKQIYLSRSLDCKKISLCYSIRNSRYHIEMFPR